MRGDLLYRCRQCGATFVGGHVPAVAEVLIRVAEDLPAPEDWRGDWPARRPIHACHHGRLGVGELVGAVPTPGDAADGR